MTTELSRVVPAKQLTLPTRDIVDLVDRYLNHIESEDYARKIITVDIPPKDRTVLSARLSHVESIVIYKQSESKFERARIDKAVSYMIGMFSVGRKISAQEAAATAKGYVMALEGVPAYFVEQACLDFAQGRVAGHDIAYTPNSAQVRTRAEELMAPYREECGKIRMILGAKRHVKPTAEEHQRMLAMTRAVLDGTDPDMRAIKDRIEADRQENLARQMQRIGRTNEIQRRKYCESVGLDPDLGVTPTLWRLLNGSLP
jgi:hypothetical protein